MNYGKSLTQFLRVKFLQTREGKAPPSTTTNGKGKKGKRWVTDTQPPRVPYQDREGIGHELHNLSLQKGWRSGFSFKKGKKKKGEGGSLYNNKRSPTLKGVLVGLLRVFIYSMATPEGKEEGGGERVRCSNFSFQNQGGGKRFPIRNLPGVSTERSWEDRGLEFTTAYEEGKGNSHELFPLPMRGGEGKRKNLVMMILGHV